jgi:hypothetical protein
MRRVHSLSLTDFIQSRRALHRANYVNGEAPNTRTEHVPVFLYPNADSTAKSLCPWPPTKEIASPKRFDVYGRNLWCRIKIELDDLHGKVGEAHHILRWDTAHYCCSSMSSCVFVNLFLCFFYRNCMRERTFIDPNHV